MTMKSIQPSFSATIIHGCKMYMYHVTNQAHFSMATSTSMTASCEVVNLRHRKADITSTRPWNWRGGRPINEIPIRGKTTLRVTAAPAGLSRPNQPINWGLLSVPNWIFFKHPSSTTAKVTTLLHFFPVLPARAVFSQNNLGVFLGPWDLVFYPQILRILGFQI